MKEELSNKAKQFLLDYHWTDKSLKKAENPMILVATMIEVFINDYYLQPVEQPAVVMPDEEDIENASLDYVAEMSFHELATMSVRSAYKQGAFDMRDNKIYISPKA